VVGAAVCASSSTALLIVPASHLPPKVRNYGGAPLRWMMESDFATWSVLKLARLFPGIAVEKLAGTPSAVFSAATPSERARLDQVIGHLLPMRARFRGMQFDIEVASGPESVRLNSIAPPVLAISAEDDLFGTASRARYIAAQVPCGRALIYPTGGHALVGRQEETLRELVSFAQAAPSPIACAPGRSTGSQYRRGEWAIRQVEFPGFGG
jgi:2-hydroxy-6-oxonona-2,4-dienedioate hydrolase